MIEVYTKPRTGAELMKACPGTPVYLYSKICDRVKEVGIGQALAEMFARSPRCFILLQNPNDMSSGHWNALSIHPATKEIYYFSSYGGKPDAEKNHWLPVHQQYSSHQDANALNDGLKEMALRGWTVHYNDHPYQYEGDKTATCGIWCVAFLKLGMNPDDFYYYTLRYHLNALDYFNAFF